MRHFRPRNQWLLVFKNIVEEMNKCRMSSRSGARVIGDPV